MHSLRVRVVGWATLYLAVLLAVLGGVIQAAHRYSVESAQQERLKAYILTLLAATDVHGRVVLPTFLPGARFNQLASGLIAAVFHHPDEVNISPESRSRSEGTLIWHSQSAVGVNLPVVVLSDMGLMKSDRWHFGSHDYVSMSYLVSWEFESDSELKENVQLYTFWVAESDGVIQHQLHLFQQRLWLGMFSLGVLFILGQYCLLRWGLRPLARLSNEIKKIESGELQQVNSIFPRELNPVVLSLNALLASLKRQREKLNHTLDELAHSLKTPLAVIRNSLHPEQGKATTASNYPLIEEQVSRMDKIIQYQLRKLSRADSGTWLQGVMVAPEIERMTRALQKLYADKNVQLQLKISANSVFFGDIDDFYEIIGNVLENAFKYCKSIVKCSVSNSPADHDLRSSHLQIEVEDDGAGITTHLRDQVLQRGVRADSHQVGQGIGLAVVHSLVTNYNGSLKLEQSPLGGLKVLIENL